MAACVELPSSFNSAILWRENSFIEPGAARLTGFRPFEHFWLVEHDVTMRIFLLSNIASLLASSHANLGLPLTVTMGTDPTDWLSDRCLPVCNTMLRCKFALMWIENSFYNLSCSWTVTALLLMINLTFMCLHTAEMELAVNYVFQLRQTVGLLVCAELNWPAAK